MDDAQRQQLAQARFGANLFSPRPQGNLHSLPKSSDRAPKAACPLLTGALAVALRLVRVHLPHFFQEIFRVRPGNIGRAWTTFVSLLRTPRSGAKPLLHTLRQGKKFKEECQEGELM